jgi:hypothetical protein
MQVLVPTVCCCDSSTLTQLTNMSSVREMGEFPVILVKELDIWEPVLRATIALQMDSTRKYILARLGDDKPNIPSKAIPLLKLVVQYEEAPKNLKLECLRTLAYRRKPISRHEATALGREATYQVMLVRERVRSCFFSNQILANIDVSDSCDNPEACKDAIYQQIASNMSSESTSKSGGDKSDIFRMAKVDGLCHFCHPQRLMLASSLKINLLDQEIQRCMETLQPPAYEK